MAIGIPGMRVGAPFFISGEPRREYQFKFLLASSDLLGFLKRPLSVSALFSSLALVYVSSLAETVNPPSSKLSVGDVTVGTLQGVPFPKGFETPTFSVIYLEDELESVYKFHLAWQKTIGSLKFEALGNVCCKAMYAPTKKVPLVFSDNFGLGLDIPLGVEVWPYVFPSEVSKSAANQTGNGVMKTTVVYTRVPDTSAWSYVATDQNEITVNANINSYFSNIKEAVI